MLRICLQQIKIFVKFWNSTKKYYEIRELFLLFFLLCEEKKLTTVEKEDGHEATEKPSIQYIDT